MNRRELLKSLPAVAALLPTVTEKGAAYKLEEGPFYLFVLNPSAADLNDFLSAFQLPHRVRGAIVIARDCDVENYCRIYKLDEDH
jgi:hypothetical protein